MPVGFQKRIHVGAAQTQHQRSVWKTLAVTFDGCGATPRMNGDHQIGIFAVVVDLDLHIVAVLTQHSGPAQGRGAVTVFRLFLGRGD